jgi:hypothetical protein
VGAIHRAPVQLQLAERAQLGQRLLVQGRPDAGRGPIPQPPPAGHPRAADQGAGQLVPGDPGLEHEHDPGQRGPVIDRPAARLAGAAGHGRREQRSDPLPQPVRDELLDHPHQAAQDPSRPTAATPVIQK